MMCGGYTQNENQMNDEVREMVEKLNESICQSLEVEKQAVTPLSFNSQVVAGINYKVIVQLADGSKHEVVIYKPLPHTQQDPSVTGVTKNVA